MKVGKVIKIKAVEVNRLLFLIGVLWLPVLFYFRALTRTMNKG